MQISCFICYAFYISLEMFVIVQIECVALQKQSH